MGADPDELVRCVRGIVDERLAAVVVPLAGREAAEALRCGKMLRTHLAARVACCGASQASHATIERACAAAELVHTASLCHDDVIDNALIRRGQPSLWQRVGPTGAILIGDLLLSTAFELVAEAGPECVRVLAARVSEVASAEAEEELVLLGGAADEETCLRLARQKTGSLFAFAAWSAGGDDAALRKALQEAGYRIGAAYQLADDLLDVVGHEATAAKSLGTDALRGKPTLPASGRCGPGAARDRIRELGSSAPGVLNAWPKAARAVADFLALDLQPVFDRCLPGMRIAAEAPARGSSGA